MQRRRIQTTGQRSSAGRNCQVVRPRQSCDTVDKNGHILFMLYQTFCPLDHHLRYPLMVFRQLIKGRIDHFHILSANSFLDIRHFFWPFIDQQNDQMHLRIIAQNRLRRFLQKGSFTCLWRRNDHSPLSLTNRADQIGDPHGHTSTGPFQTKSLIRENRGHILKIPPAAALIRRHSIDRSHI